MNSNFYTEENLLHGAKSLLMSLNKFQTNFYHKKTFQENCIFKKKLDQTLEHKTFGAKDTDCLIATHNSGFGNSSLLSPNFKADLEHMMTSQNFNLPEVEQEDCDKPTSKIIKSMQKLTDLGNRCFKTSQGKRSWDLLSQVQNKSDAYSPNVNDNYNTQIGFNQLNNSLKSKEFKGVETGNPYNNDQYSTNLAIRKAAVRRAASQKGSRGQ